MISAPYALGTTRHTPYYLVDEGGRLRARFIGETQAGTERARRVEEAIETLLAESGAE